MTSREHLVHQYMDGFRASDHQAILACLTDDIVWHIHGVRTTRGKAEFDDEIENPDFEGSPELTVDRTIDAGDVIVITGVGIGHHREHGRFRFAYCDLFTFAGDLIAQVDSYLAPLPTDSSETETYQVTRHNREIARIVPRTHGIELVPRKRRSGSHLAALPRHELRTTTSIDELLADERDR